MSSFAAFLAPSLALTAGILTVLSGKGEKA